MNIFGSNFERSYNLFPWHRIRLIDLGAILIIEVCLTTHNVQSYAIDYIELDRYIQYIP